MFKTSKIFFAKLSLFGGHVEGMLQPYNRLGLSFSVVNSISTKTLIRNCTIEKCFSFHETLIFDFTIMFCSIILFFNALNLDSKCLFKPPWINHLKEMVEICISMKFLLVVSKFVQRIIVEIQRQDTDFSINVHYYCLLLLIFFKVALIQN